MLSFLRKHQKYFFAVITFVIVISFSFFGTYSTLGGNSIHEQVAFKTIAGQDVTRSELEEMALFLGTDAEDKKLFGGIWGPNFLNDGVIRQGFLETGLAEILIEAYSPDLKSDFQNRFAKETRYQPYVHPKAGFVSSQNAWKYFAPQMSENLAALQKTSNPLSPDAVNARIQLFLAERRFPSPYLKQVLRYQEAQNGGVEKDSSLDYQDLSLFGYHTVEDWFGPRFVRLISEFVFNAAAIAEERGYSVSKEEALADLMLNSEISFKENKGNPQITVGSSIEYFDQQLMRMRLDRTKASKIWQKVLLFRRLFNDVSSAVFVDPSAYTSFNQFANQGVKGDLYRLPEALKFSDFRMMQRFETYLNLTAKKNKNALGAPTEFLTVAEISKKAPELVQKKYRLEIGEVTKRDIQAGISLKDTLAWELNESNWSRIKTQFPELGSKKGATSDERLNSIETLDAVTRSRLDQLAREEIVSAHPEKIGEALDNAKLRSVNVGISLKGANNTFAGLDSGDQLISLLDKATPGQQTDALNKVTFDKNHYYRIQVIEQSPDLEVLSFQEAVKGPILDKLTEQALEITYAQVRSSDPATYQNADKSWKPIDQVRDKVALVHYKNILEEIRTRLKLRGEKYQNLEGERLVPYRFIAWGENLIGQLKQDPTVAEKITRGSEITPTYTEQFKWVKSPLSVARKSLHDLPEAEKLLALGSNQWSDLVLAPNGDIYFAYVTGLTEAEGANEALQTQLLRARFLLGSDAERTYLYSILPLLKEKNAISFEYIYSGESKMEPDV